MTQTIYINGRFLTHPVTGVQRYGLELIQAMDDLSSRKAEGFENYEFIVLTPKVELPALNLSAIRIKQVGALKGHLWEQLELPVHAFRHLLLNPCNTAPLFKRKQAVTLHDAAVYAVPDTYSRLFRLWYKIMFPALGLLSQQILTCSTFSKDQLIRYCGIPSSKMSVIPHGREHVLRAAADHEVLKKHGLDKPFVLAVSSMSPNKNFGSIVKAIQHLNVEDVDFVIAGGSNPKLFQEQGELPDSVKYLGYVEEEELRALYEHAACFVFPSFYEGFGFPPLEAMTCGCPVIASHTASIPEVCGEAAIYCDPYDWKDIASKIQRVLKDPDLQDQMRARGFEQSSKFSWERCAKETFAAITADPRTHEIPINNASRSETG
ncbi:glycosyltransferase family 4 protein [Paenibacillus sp. JSM ZJ436]|uniref:glycosyltransferase family 4 protein n=1 Tax=Paenibacillus sp. JSM ZJ436 TaxID=3376190 RepID=UPI0037ABD6FA